MSGEDGAGATAFQCRIEVIAVLHVLADPLQPQEPGVPSLVWNTVGDAAPVIRQYARMARTPPMPSSTSCSSRWSVPPPYSRSVTSRSASVLLDVGVQHQ